MFSFGDKRLQKEQKREKWKTERKKENSMAKHVNQGVFVWEKGGLQTLVQREEKYHGDHGEKEEKKEE